MTATPMTRSTNRDARGSIMILVVVVLVLLTLMGTAYIQVARMDRISTAQITRNNIDIVAGAAVAYIAEVLRNDVVSSGSKFFDPAAYIEPYDYPYTAGDLNGDGLVDGSDEVWVIRKSDGTNFVDKASGSRFDDTWLASTAPDFSGTDPAWPHLTNLYGLFLRLPEKVTGPTIPDQPEELPVNNQIAGDYWRRDTAVPITGGATITALDDATSPYDTLGADADGDGVYDSKWTWAPIRQIAGISYVMAVRIIDNSALVNLSTASAMTSDGDAAFAAGATDIPRGYAPTEIDLTRLLSRISGVSTAQWQSDLTTHPNSLFAFREMRPGATMAASTFGIRASDAGLPLFPLDRIALSPNGSYFYSAPLGKVGSWLERVRYYGRGSYFIASDDEMELRYRNGLNTRVQTSLEQRMPKVLRDDGTVTTNETTFLDLNYGGFTDATTDAKKRLVFFQGASTTGTVIATEPVSSRKFITARHMLTNRSGAAVWAPNHGDMFSAARTLRYDLLTQDRDLTTGAYLASRVSNIAERLYAVLELGAPRYLGLSDPEVQQVAVEYAANIQDYSDTDNTPTGVQVGGSGPVYYGLEKMPFLREVYIQAGYTDEDRFDAAGNEVGHPSYTAQVPPQYDTWVMANKTQVMAVELANPFDRPITSAELAGIRLVVKQGGTDVVSYTLSGMGINIPSRGRVILYSDPEAAAGAATTEDTGGTPYGTDLVNDLDLNDAGVQKVKLVSGGDPVLNFAGDSDVEVELQVDVGSGSYVAYDRLAQTGFQLPRQESRYPTESATQLGPQHGQASIGRPSQDFQYLSNLGMGTIGAGIRKPSVADAPGNYRRTGNDARDKLEEDDKGLTGGAADLGADFQIPLPSRPILNVAELGWIFMFGFSDENTPPGKGTFPERIKTTAAERRFLDISTAAVIPDSTGIPHAAMLMDVFTTLSPNSDGVDNDLDKDLTVDNDEEQLIPGTINVNTASLQVLALASPLPEVVDDVEALMKKVIEYRDDPTSRTGLSGGTVRATPGIASIGELLLVGAGSAAGAVDKMQRYGDDGLDEQGTVVDLYPAPEEFSLSNPPALHSAIDGPEEKISRFQFLAQTLSTRSDIFTAYILVRGYNANDFRQGPVESKQLIVVFDRSGLVTGTESVRILGVYELN